MVRIPMFYLDEVIEGAPHQLHPMFKINDHKYRCIYISKYQNVTVGEDGDEKAYSLPGQDPRVIINYDDAYDACKRKGKGWHLMTNAEWAGIALWCKVNSFQPKGNNTYGKDIADEALPQKAVPSYINPSDSKIWRTATGSGPLSWYHDNTEAGIADLNGNVWEWASGVRLKAGEINIIKDNDAADTSNLINAESTLWKAVKPDGSLVPEGPDEVCKYTVAYNNQLFSAIATDPIAIENGATRLESLCLLPHAEAQSADYGEDAVWVNLEDERVPLRGGSFGDGASSGVFALNLLHARTLSHGGIGFRSSYFDEADQDDNIPESEAV